MRGMGSARSMEPFVLLARTGERNSEGIEPHWPLKCNAGLQSMPAAQAQRFVFIRCGAQWFAPAAAADDLQTLAYIRPRPGTC